MAEPISIASGLLALTLFAFQSSRSLYQAVKSFQSHDRCIRELRAELEALMGVLQPLKETASDGNTDLEALKLPLLRCGKACNEFQDVLAKCTAHSKGSRTSFRDWGRLWYMGDNVDAFKNTLAGYKSTIIIALSGVNLRTTTITAELLIEYTEMVKNTTCDLEEHLQKIDDKLKALSIQNTATSDETATEQQRLQEERDSTQQCLNICANLSKHIDQIQISTLSDISTRTATYEVPIGGTDSSVSAKLATAGTLNECKTRLTKRSTHLEKYLQEINGRLQEMSSQPSRQSEEDVARREGLREDMESIKQCLAICARATEQVDQDRINIFEDVSMADDGHQIIVATLGDLISAKRVSAGARAKQWLGQMSDASLQQLSRDQSRMAMDDQAELQAELQAEPQAGAGAEYTDRYGSGYRLSSGKFKE